MKLIFLNVDGCLVKEEAITQETKEKRQKRNKIYFDEDNVKTLKEIIKETNSELILTGEWKPAEDLKNETGIDSKTTPTFSRFDGALEKLQLVEIFSFLCNYYPIPRYLIVDSMSLSNYLPDSVFEYIDPAIGLKKNNKSIIQKLNGKTI